MQKYEYQSDFARTYYGEGHAEGCAEGLRKAVLLLAAAKVGDLPTEVTERLCALGDPSVLERLLVELGQSQDAKAARALLARIGV